MREVLFHGAAIGGSDDSIAVLGWKARRQFDGELHLSYVAIVSDMIGLHDPYVVRRNAALPAECLDVNTGAGANRRQEERKWCRGRRIRRLIRVNLKASDVSIHA